MSKDGGPAFPRPVSEVMDRKGYIVDEGDVGMSLRDYFAASALTVQISPPEAAARIAYEYADAMLKVRRAAAEERNSTKEK
jgi:hypothetical protein